MSEETSFVGKVHEVQFDVQIPYATKAGTYAGTLLLYTAGNDDIKRKAFTSKTLELHTNIREGLEGLKPGDYFKMTSYKKGKFSNVTDVHKVIPGQDDPKPKSQSAGFSGGGSNVLGMIKGNTITNAVVLATHNAKGKVGYDDLVEAAHIILRVHGHLEESDIEALMAGGDDLSDDEII